MKCSHGLQLSEWPCKECEEEKMTVEYIFSRQTKNIFKGCAKREDCKCTGECRQIIGTY